VLIAARCILSSNALLFSQLNSHLKPQSKLVQRGNIEALAQSDKPIEFLGTEKRPYRMGEKPGSTAELAAINYKKEVLQIFGSVKLFSDSKLTVPESLQVTLSNEAVKNAEMEREKANGRMEASKLARFLYDVGCFFLDNFFDGRPIARFWFLETVARIPYFAYVTMLHLYESFGWLRQHQLRKVHSAEEWNELHHLIILESLGGDKVWVDRFLGYHAAIVYYWLLLGAYAFSPAAAYQFMELLEAHAIDTYGTFLETNEARLKTIKAPQCAIDYYTGPDLYEFDEFMAGRPVGSRRPPCDTLYDVFVNIRDDEAEHVSTMKLCQEYANDGKIVRSPHAEYYADMNK
jgi:ubiquinol oxidase